VAWGFGRYAPEASAGTGKDSENEMNIRLFLATFTFQKIEMDQGVPKLHQGAGAAPRFAKPRGACFSIGTGGPFFAETHLVSLRQAEIPAGAFANRAAAPAPSPGSRPKNKRQK